jgi:hypothetical protein
LFLSAEPAHYLVDLRGPGRVRFSQFHRPHSR